MKIIIHIFFLLFFSSSSVLSQKNYRAITPKFGYFNPKDIPGSYLVGGSYTFRLNEFQEIGIAMEYFYYNKDRDSTLNKDTNAGVTEKLKQTDSTTTIHLVPLSLILMFRFPALKYHYYYFSGTIGYELMYYKKRKYTPERKKESRSYRGIKLSLGTGFIYRLTVKYAIIAEIYYDIAHVTHDKNEPGAPIKGIIDLSGLSVRIGIRIGGF